jgi:hypothetical protein
MKSLSLALGFATSDACFALIATCTTRQVQSVNTRSMHREVFLRAT